MRLGALRLQNFRSCSDVTIDFDDYTCFVGPNGAGKSTVLAALNILFRHNSGSATSVVSLADEDFCNRNTKVPITITATFIDLTDDEKEDFKAYYRQSRLIVSARAEWIDSQSQAVVKQYGSRMVMKAFAPWFAASADGVKAADLKELYASLARTHENLPKATSKADMEAALRQYEEAHPELCELIDSEDQFYGWSKGENRLRKYIQWVYVPAVKDAHTEQDEAKNTALGELLQRTIRSKVDFEPFLKVLRENANREYQELLSGQQDMLADVSSALQNRLRSWAHPGAKLELTWNFDSEKSVVIANPAAKAAAGEGSFLGEVSRLGHGLQRAFIVSLLQELAWSDGKSAPRLLLGFEEPELYQHPPQARHLSALLQEISRKNSQTIVTTHSPYFVSGRGFESIRMVRKNSVTGHSTMSSLTMERLSEVISAALGGRPDSPTAIMAAVEQILQPSQSELFFCGFPVLVEGLEDIAFISTYLQLLGYWTEFRRLGGHFVIAEGKTSLSRPLAIANELGIPAFVIFDGDCDQTKDGEPKRNRRDNGCILRLCGLDSVDPLSQEVIWGTRVVMWPTRIADAVRDELGATLWNEVIQDTEKKHGFAGVRRKSGLLIAATLENLWQRGNRSELLVKTCDAVLAFGSSQKNSPEPEAAELTAVRA